MEVLYPMLNQAIRQPKRAYLPSLLPASLRDDSGQELTVQQPTPTAKTTTRTEDEIRKDAVSEHPGSVHAMVYERGPALEGGSGMDADDENEDGMGVRGGGGGPRGRLVGRCGEGCVRALEECARCFYEMLRVRVRFH